MLTGTSQAPPRCSLAASPKICGMDLTRSPIIPAAALAHEHEPGDADDFDRGLEFDLGMLRRRGALKILGGASLLALAGCGTDAAAGAASSTTSSGSTSSSATSAGGTSSGSGSSSAGSAGGATPAAEVPDETAGPYPGDGSNGADVLDDAGVVRADIRTSIGGSAAVAGAPATIHLTVTDAANGYAALAGAAVYVWHCDAAGNYSMYSSGVEDETFLRGVQATDATGTATFTSVFPGCYPGRWPHIHFEVYASTDQATSSGQIVKTSQIALPQAVAEQVYADTATYPVSASNLARLSLTTDNVFGEDGGVLQLATVTGDPGAGYVVNLTIGV